MMQIVTVLLAVFGASGVAAAASAPVMCNSYGCPNGWIPIPDAAQTPCRNGKCTTRQCCESFCWSFPCPGPYIPDPITVNDRCPSSIGCTLNKCCAAFCWGHACPNGLIPNPKTVNDQCPDSTCTGDHCPPSGCTDELCCIKPYEQTTMF